MHDIIYSIIIPHKNIPNLLQRCLDSIPKRDDLEVIIVDDNSDDIIVDFNKFPGAERNDVNIIFDKSNKGPGFARNIGISKAKGRWIIFVDADDYFNYCVRDVLKDYMDDTSDVVFFAASSVDSDTYQNSSRADGFVEIINKYFNDKCSGELLLRYVLASPCGKLIKRNLLEKYNIFFPDVVICEDVEFSYKLGLYIKELDVDRRALCCYTSRTISRSSVLSDEVLLDKIRVYAKRDKFLLEHHIPLSLGTFYIQQILDLENLGEKELYDKAFLILQECEIPHKMIWDMIKARRTNTNTIIDNINKIRCRLAIRTRIKEFF